MNDPLPTDEEAPGEDLRARIIAAAAQLVATGGRDAATTRAIAAAAGVQPPTIYRLFGDKRGLLNEVVQQGIAAYVAAKSERPPHPDPIEELRHGWDMHVDFGLTNSGLFTILASDPNPSSPSPAVAKGLSVVQRRIKNVALAGRLKISEERAVALLQCIGIGTVLTLLDQPPELRDLSLSEIAREAYITAITGEAISEVDSGPKMAAIALRASLDHISVLTAGEKHLLDELLDRIAILP